MKKLIQSSRFTGKIVVVVAAVIGGASIVSSSAFASLSAVATAETTVNSGTLKLQHATPASFGAGFITAVGALDLSSHGGLASGDTVNRFIDLSSTGSLDGASPKLFLTAGATALNQDGKGLYVEINKCSVDFTALTGACSGTATAVLAATSIYDLNAAAGVAGTTLSALTTSAGAVNHLKITYTLVGNEVTVNGNVPTTADSYNPGFTGTSIQGVTGATLTWKFQDDFTSAGATNS